MMVLWYVFLQLKYLAEFVLRSTVHLRVYFIRVFLNQICSRFQEMFLVSVNRTLLVH